MQPTLKSWASLQPESATCVYIMRGKVSSSPCQHPTAARCTAVVEACFRFKRQRVASRVDCLFFSRSIGLNLGIRCLFRPEAANSDPCPHLSSVPFTTQTSLSGSKTHGFSMDGAHVSTDLRSLATELKMDLEVVRDAYSELVGPM